MRAQSVLSWIVISGMFVTAGCDRDKTGQSAATASDNFDPMESIEALLKRHDLLGKQPTERTKAERQKKIGADVYALSFADFEAFDPFLADLYAGFVVGALASNQTRLRVETKGERAEVVAGNLRVVMRNVEQSWRIVLSESVPAVIKQRAREERDRYHRAGRLRAD